MKKGPLSLHIAFILILGFAIYIPSLNGKFLWDDIPLIKDNIYIKNWSNIPNIFTKDIVAGAGIKSNFYRPIQMLTYMLDYSIWELNVVGYHLTNVILHILATLGVYWFIYILFKNNLLSFLTSLFFLVHPIHTEAVSYISGRADSLALVFMLLCLILYARKKLYFVMLLCYALALLSRENTLILPLLILLYHYTFKEPIKLKWFMPISTVALLYVILRLTLLSYLLPHLVARTTILQRLPGVFVAITDYLRLLFLPFGLHMEYENKLFNLSEPKAMLGIIIAVLLLIYAFRKRKRDRLISFSILWFFIALLPVSNIYPLIIAYMAEHWLYVPSVGFFLVVAYGLSSIYRSRHLKVLSVALIAGLLGFYSYLTVKQNRTWVEPIPFYERTLKHAPESVRTLTGLGIEHRISGNIEKAIELFKKAIEIKPNFVYAHNNLGLAYSAMGKQKEAAKSFREAIKINPHYASAYINLGNIYSDREEYEEAIALYKKAMEINPVAGQAYNNLANAYSETGKTEEAIELYKKALKINPNDADTYYNLATLYSKIGKYEEAIALYKKAMEINPNDPATHYNLSMTYYSIKQYDLAIKHCDKAIELGFKAGPEFLERLKPYRR